jgi:hypothetical protein
LRVDLSKIDFALPRRSHFCTNPKDLAWARREIRSYLASRVLAPAPSGFNLLAHPWFVVRRKGKRRLVVDFEKLNAAILHSTSVSYEDLSTVPALTRRRPWMISIDLKAAFHHVPLSPSLQRLSCIQFEGAMLCFTVMTFGLSMAPKIWCSILASALNALRHHPSDPIHLSFYMDDILLAAPTRSLARLHALRLVRHLSSLGLVINYDKSSLSPARRLRHLGFLIDTTSHTFQIPPDKASDISSFTKTVSLRPHIRIPTAQSLLGKLLALRIAFTPVRRYTWSLIHELTAAIPPHRRRRSQLRHLRISLSPSARSDLIWISNNIRSFPPARYASRPTLHLYTDASLSGWGAWSPQLSISLAGRWRHAPHRPMPHIQLLELTAVYHAISQLPIPAHSSIALHTDNMSVLAYIAKWGGSGNRALHRLVQHIWDLLLSRSAQIVSVDYLPSALNQQADWLSRLL